MPAESIVRAPRLVALALLAFLLPLPAAAGPPEGVSGRMALASDEVADGLRKYRKEKDCGRALALLRILAPTKDPRVAMVLGELLTGQDEDVSFEAAVVLKQTFPSAIPSGVYREQALFWWKVNEAALRRRAKELPR
jgi:hypothetical protein